MPDLAGLAISVIDVAGGERIPRKGGPGITRSDLPAVNKTDRAEPLGASLEIVERDTKVMRGARRYAFASIRSGQGVAAVARLIEHAGGFEAP